MERNELPPRRFVVLRHEMPAGSARPSHWDFMIDVGEALRTWALADEPAAEHSIVAESLADHRRAYLDYEGPVSGDRGVVTRWDAGTYQVIRSTEDVCLLDLAGTRLRGQVMLAHETGVDYWTFRFSSGVRATPV